MEADADIEVDDVVTRALDNWKVTKEGWSEIYQKARDDLYFLSDAPNAQWDEQTLQKRKNKPNYTVDQLGKFIRQVSNDIRQNTPTINVSPVGSGADVKTAEIFKGIIKGIEYKSNADAAYDTAADFSIKSSIGYIRIDHDYIDNEGFDQELLIKRVVNPQSCFIDPNSVEPDGSDAMYGYVLEEISKDDFEKRYPNKTAVSFGEKIDKSLPNQDKITIAEYFEIIEKEADITSGEKSRKAKMRKVMRYKLSGVDKLEETSFPGKYIPIIPVYGEEAWIEGKRNLFSLIRKSKSAQQLFNLGMSLDIEILMMQPQAPFIGVAGQFEGFEDGYADVGKVAVLQHTGKNIDGEAVPAPQRLQPPSSSSGFSNMMVNAAENIKATTGLYDANIGNRSQETSGIAIQRRQQQGNTAVYHFADNLVRSITHVGKILVCAIPEIYDTEREVRIVTDEEESKIVGINGKVVEGQEDVYDLSKGKYDVVVTTGAAYTTQRQEAAEFYSQLIQAMPDLMPVIGDLVFKYQDSAGSQAISARLKKLVDPKLLDKSELDSQEQDPQIAALTQQLQAIQQEAQATIAQLQAELQSKQSEQQLKAGELQIKNKEVEIKAFEAEQKAMQAQQVEAPIDNTMDTAIKLKELEIKEFEAKSRAENEKAKLLLEAEKIKLDSLKMLSDNSQDSDVESGEVMDTEDMFKQQQKEAQLAMLQGIIQSVQGLTAAIQAPMQALRDEQGNIIGAA